MNWTLLRLLTSAFVQVFGRRQRDLTTRSGDRRPKSAKARNRVGGSGKRRRGRVVPQRLWGFGQASDAGEVRAREVETVFCSARRMSKLLQMSA